MSPVIAKPIPSATAAPNSPPQTCGCRAREEPGQYHQTWQQPVGEDHLGEGVDDAQHRSRDGLRGRGERRGADQRLQRPVQQTGDQAERGGDHGQPEPVQRTRREQPLQEQMGRHAGQSARCRRPDRQGRRIDAVGHQGSRCADQCAVVAHQAVPHRLAESRGPGRQRLDGAAERHERGGAGMPQSDCDQHEQSRGAAAQEEDLGDPAQQRAEDVGHEGPFGERWRSCFRDASGRRAASVMGVAGSAAPGPATARAADRPHRGAAARWAPSHRPASGWRRTARRRGGGPRPG